MELVLDIPKLKLISINDKYGFNRRTGSAYLTKAYREFKEYIYFSVNNLDKINLNPPHAIKIIMHTYIDIDNSEKAILDAISKRLGTNDRDILQKHIDKYKVKRGQLSSLKVWFGHLDRSKAI